MFTQTHYHNRLIVSFTVCKMKPTYPILLSLLLVSTTLYGQDENLKSKTKKAWRGMINDLTAAQNDTLVNIKSQDVFLPFEGKIIRNIAIDHVGFEISLYDSTKKAKKAIVNIGNALHADTKPKTIRENLFIKKGEKLNAYKLADNERYLRNLAFIVDARIQIVPIENSDSVDLVVVARDAFSLGFSGYPSNVDEGEFRIYDTNLLGQGQFVQYGGEWDGGLDPGYGSEFLYSKTSAFGSLINASLYYSQVNSGRSLGDEYEYAYGVRLDRPLRSAHMRLAGGYEWSNNWSENVETKADTSFRDYNYFLSDFWIGYNIGIKKERTDRSRYFVALRWYNQTFQDFPTQTVEMDNPDYNNNYVALSEFTFYNKDFYRTRYIYGFGITEDVQYGSEVSVLLGSVKRLNLERPYAGIEADRIWANDKGDLIGLTLNLSSYIGEDQLQDATFVSSVRLFTRLYSMPHVKIREFVNFSYTQEFNGTDATIPLELTGRYGLNGFNADSLVGTKRYAIQSQTVFFTNWMLLGFRFAGVAYVEIASIADHHQNLLTTAPYYGIGLGIRTRNENLSFGTMEAKVQFYPRTPEGVESFRFTFSTNLRFRSTGILVNPPTIVNYNER